MKVSAFMHKQRETDPILGELFLPGKCVAAGIYRQVDSNREVSLEEEGYLPASLDGRVACYARIPSLKNDLCARRIP